MVDIHNIFYLNCNFYRIVVSCAYLVLVLILNIFNFFNMFKVSLVYFILLYLFLILKVVCDDKLFWINPCGYSSKNGEDLEDNDDTSIMNRILLLANLNQNNIDGFVNDYINSTFGHDHSTHYRTWKHEKNVWMTTYLLKDVEDDSEKSWLTSHSFPNELILTYEILQRVSVGFELLLEDSNIIDSSEHNFVKQFSTCKNNLKELLCEISDSIEIKGQERPVDIDRKVMPEEVRRETSTARRTLTNSIIFRDYMLAIKYIKTTFDYLLGQSNNILGKNV